MKLTSVHAAAAVMIATLIGCGSGSSPTAPLTQGPPPAGATAAMVTEGRTLYATGTCVTCHGSTGKNGPYGPDLTDNVFLHNSGAYEEIIAIIASGVPASDFKSPASQKDFFMLPKGAMTLSDAQLRSLAAYVWTLSHPNG